MRRMFAVVSVCLLLGAPAFAQQPEDDRTIGAAFPVAPEVITRDTTGNATVRTMRLPSPLEFDGRLDEAFYKDIKSFGDFVQQEPFEGQPATEKTDVWIFFDDKNLYVSARNWETDSTRRVMSDMQRDARNLFNNDHFQILFDTFNDRRNGYSFQSNAQGGMSDTQLTNETPNSNWNGLWDVRTADFDGGWTVEFRIPFRSLRFKEDSRVWGVNFRRLVRWKNESSFLTPIPQSYGRRGFTKVSSAGTLVGLETPSRMRNIDVKPYLLGSTQTNHLATPPITNDGNAEFGVDAKWGITQSIATDFTYNTDFAQVEDDEAQVNLTRFSLFFPEKREFFLEGQDYFNFGGGNFGGGGGGGGSSGGGGGGFGPSSTPVVFYSRRIGLSDGLQVPILAGGRMLGRSGGFQLGALHMRTEDAPEAAAVATDFSVLRLNRDILSRSRVGLIATRRAPGAEAGVADNYAYGADASFNFRTDLSASTYWSKTQTPGRSNNDTSYKGRFDWSADGAGVQAEHLYVGDDFNPEVGFLRRSAFRRSYAQGRYSPRPKNVKHVRKFFFEASEDYYENTAGQVESREEQGTFRVEFTNTDQLTLEYTSAFERLDEPFEVAKDVTVPPGDYAFGQSRVSYMLSPSRPLSGFLSMTYGDFYGGTLTEASWRGRVEFSSHLYAEPTISFNHVDGPFGTGNTNLIGSRVTYTISPRMFVSALIQYQSFNETVTTNARLRWEYSPGSELFVVYSDGRDTLGTGAPPPIINQSFVVKATRLFRW